MNSSVGRTKMCISHTYFVCNRSLTEAYRIGITCSHAWRSRRFNGVGVSEEGHTAIKTALQNQMAATSPYLKELHIREPSNPRSHGKLTLNR